MNSTRGNNYFDVSNPLASGYKAYSNLAAGVAWSRTSLTWEPPDLTKGDCARAMLYMTVRYIGDAGEPKLSLTDNTNLIISGSTYMGRYTSLLKWHFLDPVSAAEQARNEIVYSFQTNRNPFIDHPEWVAAAFIPPMTIALTGTNIVLGWTNDYAPTMVIEDSTSPGSAWLMVTNTPTLINSNWTSTLPAQSGSRFYHSRLQ